MFLREMAAEVKNFMDFKMSAVMVSHLFAIDWRFLFTSTWGEKKRNFSSCHTSSVDSTSINLTLSRAFSGSIRVIRMREDVIAFVE